MAWALGLTADAATIGIDGDESKGKAEIADDSLLPLIDKSTLCRRLGAHHCIMFSTTSLKSLPLSRVKFH